jgi:hypothetical protein
MKGRNMRKSLWINAEEEVSDKLRRMFECIFCQTEV